MRYMISFTFIPDRQSEIQAVLPEELAHINLLRERDIIEEIYLISDGSGGWIVMKGESKEEIQKTLEAFPLYPHIAPEPEIVTLR